MMPNEENTPDLSPFHGYPAQQPAQNPHSAPVPIPESTEPFPERTTIKQWLYAVANLKRVTRAYHVDAAWLELKSEGEEWERINQMVVATGIEPVTPTMST